MERPGYLGAIEAFSLYEPEFAAVPLDSEGPDLAAFKAMQKAGPVKFFYGIPNSQNPSGCTYSQDRRKGNSQNASKVPIRSSTRTTRSASSSSTINRACP